MRHFNFSNFNSGSEKNYKPHAQKNTSTKSFKSVAINGSDICRPANPLISKIQVQRNVPPCDISKKIIKLPVKVSGEIAANFITKNYLPQMRHFNFLNF